MTIDAYPFDADTMDELGWQRMARIWLPDGVDALPSSTSFKVSSTGSLTTAVAGGTGSHAWVRGIFVRLVGDYALSHVINASSNPRIDRVVLRGDLATNTAVPVVITGTPAATPAAPAMTYTEETFDLPLAEVRVEANDTISAVTDRRRFLGRPTVPCTSTNRPDTQGRPLTAYETDTNRFISNSGTGGWNVGLGDDAFRPLTNYSDDSGTTAGTVWDTTLNGADNHPTLNLSFAAPASGRVMVRIGAWLGNTSNATTYMAVRLNDALGASYWVTNDGPLTASRWVRYAAPGGGLTGSSVHGAWMASTLNPGELYTATLRYAVSGGTGHIDDRSLEVHPLP